MKRLLQFTKGKLRNISTLPEFDKKLAVSALAGTIKYLEVQCELYFIHARIFKMNNFRNATALIWRVLSKSVSSGSL